MQGHQGEGDMARTGRRYPSFCALSVDLLAVERVGVHSVHVDIHQLPLQLGAIPREVAQLVVPRAAHRLRPGGEGPRSTQ